MSAARHQQESRISFENYALMFYSSPDFILILDSDGLVTLRVEAEESGVYAYWGLF